MLHLEMKPIEPPQKNNRKQFYSFSLSAIVCEVLKVSNFVSKNIFDLTFSNFEISKIVL